MTAVTAEAGVGAAAPARSAPDVRMTPTLWPRYAVALVLAIALPPLLGRAGVLNDSRALTLGTGACFAMAGISLNVLMGYAGQISLGHFAFLGTGAFVSSKLTAPTLDHAGLPFWVGVVGAMAAAAVVAFLVGLPALRLRGPYLAVVTVVLNVVMVQSLFQSSWFSSGSGGVELPRPRFGATELVRNADYLAVVLGILVLVWLVDTNLTSSKLGRAFHAIRADDAVAGAYGVDVTRYKLVAFTISGAIAGLAGALYGHLFTFVNSSTFELQQSLLLLSLVVLGGLGSRVGVTVAAIVYGIASTLVSDWFGTDATGWILVVSALLLMLTISRHPTGFAGAWREVQERRPGRAAAVDADVTPRVPDLPRPVGLPERQVGVAGAPMLDVAGVEVSFGGVRAVDGVSITVPRNRIVGLIGPNGAGKTTLFNAISGALRPDRGRVRLLGRDLSSTGAHVRAAAGIARTFQSIGLAKDRSVLDNLLLAQHQVATYGLGPALSGLGPAPAVERELRERAWAAVAALGFERYADTPVGNLSHGQQRIVEIGCALATAPELVMLDEPSAGMAPGAVENLAVRLRDIRDQLGRTVLLIEHNIPLVLDVCDEVYVLANGRLIAHGEPADVVRRPEVVEAYLGEAPA